MAAVSSFRSRARLARGEKRQPHIVKRRGARHLFHALDHKGAAAVVQKRHIIGAKRQAGGDIAFMTGAADGVITFVFVFEDARVQIQMACEQLRLKHVDGLGRGQADFIVAGVATRLGQAAGCNKLTEILIHHFGAVEHFKIFRRA
jgi:hypothetical protein